MNQLFYNIASGIVQQIRREKRTTIFRSDFRGKSDFQEQLQIYICNNLKRKNLSLPLKAEIEQFVICLVLLECLSFKIWSISLSERDANRDGVFCSFQPDLRSLGQAKRLQNCLRYWTGRPSFYLYS